jgi:hypothetical protein
MNDIAELWSLRWHMLQRNLAAGIGDQRTVAGGDSCTEFAVKRQDIACSWLVRARQRAAARAAA